MPLNLTRGMSSSLMPYVSRSRVLLISLRSVNCLLMRASSVSAYRSHFAVSSFARVSPGRMS